MRLMDADKYCEFLNTYPLEKAQSNPMAFYRDALQHTFECEVEAEPVRHGRWIDKGDQKWHCSECDGIAPKGIRYNYCPNCGAKMGGENER